MAAPWIGASRPPTQKWWGQTGDGGPPPDPGTVLLDWSPDGSTLWAVEVLGWTPDGATIWPVEVVGWTPDGSSIWPVT